MKSRIPGILGIRYPILQGGMLGVSDARLAAAVSEAGALGIIAAGSLSPELLEREIELTRGLTDRPICVNIPLARKDAPDMLEVMGRKKAKIVSTSAGNPKMHTALAKSLGIKVIHVVSNVKMALKAEEAGVDIIVAEGYESGGLNGIDGITTMALVPQVVDKVKVPVVAAGGIGDARGMVAAFALGAEGVQMGTRFIATEECTVPQDYKRIILYAPDTGTEITNKGFGLTRIIKATLAGKILQAEAEGWNNERISEMVEIESSTRASQDDDSPKGLYGGGQIAGLINEIRPAAEIIEEMVEGYERIVAQLHAV